MNRIYLLGFIVIFFNSCKRAHLNDPCDMNASAETRELYYGMQRLAGIGTLFGHHDDTAYGVEWKQDDDSSDVKSITDTYPAVYGWDLAKIEHDSQYDINGVPFKLQKQRVLQAYERGGINTFCWHMDNPANNKTAWDTSQRTVAAILPGGPAHDAYLQYLNRAAKYLDGLRGKDGEAIPVLFRPFHELTGNWFWWGKNTSTPGEFKALWRFTVDYLRNTAKLHNLIIVYSAADFDSEAAFMQRYPGDKYADIIGFDEYCQAGIPGFQNTLGKRLRLLNIMAKKHHKLSCLAETGYMNIPVTDWWTRILLPALSKYKPSYLLTWRNADNKQFYVPYPGQVSANDFKTFSADEHLMFQNRLTPLKIYGEPTE